MKNRIIALVVGMALLLSATTNCNRGTRENPYPIQVVHGFVSDSLTNLPFANVFVILDTFPDSTNSNTSDSTDASGYYKIITIDRDTILPISAFKSGYVPITKYFSIAIYDTVIVNFDLKLNDMPVGKVVK